MGRYKERQTGRETEIEKRARECVSEGGWRDVREGKAIKRKKNTMVLLKTSTRRAKVATRQSLTEMSISIPKKKVKYHMSDF